MKRIFVVEDEAIVALELQDHLRRLGFEVCGHAARADAALRDIPAARPDLVLMDINLGRGMTGIDVAERLRGLLDVPVVFVTAYSDADITRRAAGSEAFAYVVKPFIPDALRANLDMALLRHDSQRKLREAQQLYEGLVAASPVGVFRTDPDGRCVYVNPMWCTIAGLTPERALGDGWIHGLHPDDRPAVFAEWQRASAERRPFRLEYRFCPAPQRQIWVLGQSAPLHDPSGAVIGHIGTITDITPRKAAEDALRDSEARYRRLFEDAIEGIFRSRVDGTLLAVNPAFAAMLGYGAPDELIGTNTAALYADPDERRRLWDHHTTIEPVDGVELRLRKQNGERITVELFARPIADADGRIAFIQGMIRDITEQAQHRAALEVLSTGLAVLAGEAFYNEVAAQLAAIVGAEIGFVTAFQPGSPVRLRTLGYVVDGREAAPVEYDIAGTPCEGIIARKAIVFPDGVQQQFPADRCLAEHGVHAYVAWPLVDAAGRLLGNIGVLARKPLSHPDRIVSVARLFALRAVAELERAAPVAPPGPPAADAPTIAGLTLHFSVSRDEEYVELRATHGGGAIDLKARAHHYLLLVLARLRLDEADLPPDEQGWIHQELLLRRLRCDSNRLHIDIYRIRRQLAEVGVRDAANIIERRAGTRQLRLGVATVEIKQLPHSRAF